MTAWLWTFYFAAKLALQLRGEVRVHFLWNAAFAALVLPLPIRREPRPPLLRGLPALAVAAALLWRDSYLPSFLSALDFLRHDPEVLTSGFLRRFATGFLPSAGALAGAAGLLALCVVAARRRLPALPFASGALLTALALTLAGPHGPESDALREFYRVEKGRLVRLPRPKGPPFDVILVQVCSLSWDDLDAVGAAAPRLLDGAAYVFTDFNSAASFSTDAVLRLLRAPCGQVSQKELYRPWPAECGLLGQLRAAGFKTYAAMDAEPDYFQMAADMRRLGGADEPVPVAGLKARLANFDGHPVYDDGDVLERWRRQRERSGEARAALFYDTLVLHDGVHADVPGWWKESELPQYLKALDSLARDLDRLDAEIAASGRSAVVVILGEHGRAIRASPAQASGLRQVPLRAITNVPVAVRLVGPAFAGAPRGRRSGKPVSYLALAQLLADVLADPRAAADARRLDEAAAALPETGFLSESADYKVFSFEGTDYLVDKDVE